MTDGGGVAGFEMVKLDSVLRLLGWEKGWNLQNKPRYQVDAFEVVRNERAYEYVKELSVDQVPASNT